MPLFFVISGMLYNKDKYPTFLSLIKRKLRTLISPYIVFSLLMLLFSMVADFLSAGIAGLVWEEYLQSLVRVVLSQGSQKIVNAALWYLTCLFVMEALYYWISKLRTTLILVISAVLAGLGWLLEAGYLGFDSAMLPWSLDSALFSFGFFAVGGVMSEMVKKGVSRIIAHKHKVLICFGILALSLAVQIPVAFWNGKVSIGSKILGNGLFFYLTGIAGTIGLLMVSILLVKSKFLGYCGKNSLYILGVHWIIWSAIQVICMKVPALAYDKEDLLETMIPFAVVLAGSLVFVAVYTRLKKLIQKRQPQAS